VFVWFGGGLRPVRLTGSRLVCEWGFEQSISADIDVFQST
jgi:hypothetical protein